MPQYHFAASLILSLILFYFTGSLPASLFCLLSGFLLDLDHIFDFWLYKRRITFSSEIFQEFYKNWGKVPVLLHSLELIILLWLFTYSYNLNPLFSIAMTIGFVSHLALDFLSYELQPLSYFLSYRAVKNFDIQFICRG